MSKDRYYVNTRLSTAKRCLRKYFFRHVLDWEGVSFNKDLAFGSAWHKAQDTLWEIMINDSKAHPEDVAEASYASFLAEWIEQGGVEPTEMDPEELAGLSPKSPLIGAEMIYGYLDARESFFYDRSLELIEVEMPFAVPLDPKDETLFYVGRIDKIFKKQGLIHGAEHKTTGLYAKHGGFRSVFIDSFSPNSQVDGYLHAGHMLYGDKFTSIWVDAALCHKVHHDIFKFVPVERQLEQLDAWLFDTKYWVHLIEMNWAVLEEKEEELLEAPYLKVFPKNTEACYDYGRACTYLGICKMVPNPLREAEKPPRGYKISVWSPFERLELDKLGMKKDG